MSKRTSPRFALFAMIAAAFLGNGLDEKTSNKRAYHQAFLDGGNPEYTPTKHTKQTYAAQNRAAKKRRKQRAKMPK